MNPEILSPDLQPKFVPELISLFESMPYEASRHFLRWGLLQESQLELFKLLKANVRALFTQKYQFRFISSDKVDTFKLEFPQDIQLLSILAPALIK